MQKTLRSLAVVLFLVASFAAAKTPAHSKTTTVVLQEGSSPMPDCYPGQVCR